MSKQKLSLQREVSPGEEGLPDKIWPSGEEAQDDSVRAGIVSESNTSTSRLQQPSISKQHFSI